jgi:hypothetical protein
MKLVKRRLTAAFAAASLRNGKLFIPSLRSEERLASVLEER